MENDLISTFQYLLYINKFSSRSFNDINQYPIFTWIFLNSLDEKNDENKFPKIRNMSYPISIKNDIDLEDAKIFFESSFEDNEKHPFHYRLHYSTSGYLLNY